MDNIKNILIELNDKSNININKILEKDKQFNDIKGNYNKKINEIYDEDFSPIKSIINNIYNHKKEYNELIESFKSNNNIFSKLNNN